MIADALRSVVKYVDVCLVIDTGSSDKTLDIARRVAGEKLTLMHFPWTKDFAAARNFALRCAAKLGFDWSLTLDSDERLCFAQDPVTFRERLNGAQATHLFLARDSVFGYHKERLIRLPSDYAWLGQTHEYLAGVPLEKRDILQELSFYELPKGKLDMSVKLLRDLRILQKETQSSPESARWWYFLGQTLELLDRPDEAVEAYQNNVRLSEWNEEVAWSRFCIARCQVRRSQHLDALKTCAQALAAFRDSPELAWLAGKCALELGNHSDAIEWAELAIALHSCPEVDQARINFRHLPAWFEAPYNVLRTAYEKANQIDAADAAALKFAEAIQTRGRASHKGAAATG